MKTISRINGLFVFKNSKFFFQHNQSKVGLIPLDFKKKPWHSCHDMSAEKTGESIFIHVNQQFPTPSVPLQNVWKMC